VARSLAALLINREIIFVEQRKQARLRSVDNVLLYGDSLSEEIGENRRSHRIDEMRLKAYKPRYSNFPEGILISGCTTK
jgi:hypothetical protein